MRTSRCTERHRSAVSADRGHLRRGSGGIGPTMVALLLSVGTGASVAALGAGHAIRPVALIATATILVAAAPIVFRLITNRFDIFEPLVGGCLMLGILFGGRPIAMLITQDTIYHDGTLLEPYFTEATTMGLFATVIFVVAYEFTRSRLERRPPRRPPRSYERNLRLAYDYGIVVSIAGLGLFAAFLARTGSIGGGLQLLTAGSSEALQTLNDSSTEYFTSAPIAAACAGIVITIVAGRQLTRRQGLIVGLAVLAPVISNFALGGRRFLIPSIAIPVLAYYLVAGRRPALRGFFGVLFVAAIVLATIPFARVDVAREQAGGVLPIFQKAFASPLKPLERFITGPDTEMVAALTVEVGALENTGDYAFGRATVGDLAIAPIPRILFPSKPTTARNEILTNLFGAPCDAVGGFCPDFSVVGTFFQDGWYVGVVLGMVLLGAASAAVWQRYLRARDNPYAVLLASSWAVFLPILVRAGFMPAFAWFLYFLIPSALGLWIAARPIGADSPRSTTQLS